METAYSTALSAIFRTESRGAHSRSDFLYRDDKNWLCHTFYLPDVDKMIRRNINMKPNFVPPFPLKERIY